MNKLMKIMIVFCSCAFTSAIFAKVNCKGDDFECLQLKVLDSEGAIREIEPVTTATDELKSKGFGGAPSTEKSVAPKPYEIPVPKSYKPKKTSSPVASSSKETAKPSKEPIYKKAKPIDMNIFGPRIKPPSDGAAKPSAPQKEQIKFKDPKSPLQPVIGQPGGIIYQ